MQVDGPNPTGNLAKNATVMMEAGYCFYNLTSHQPVISIDDL
jgi:hypothetical protein